MVVADANPTSTWWLEPGTVNPAELDADELAMAIWQAAHDAVALPNVDIRFVPRLEQPTAGKR